MKVFRIFEIVNFSLYSIQFEGEELDEWRKLLRDWSDPIFLREFFEENEEDLFSGFYQVEKIEDIIQSTFQDAEELVSKILFTAKYGGKNANVELQQIFKPLENSNFKVIDFRKEKAYGLVKPAWLRIYAIRINTSNYVITGSAIKLTKTMNEKEHLVKELKKLEVARNWLKENNFDIDG